MNYILESNGVYFLSKSISGRLIAKSEDSQWCERWVSLLNKNPLKEGYMSARKYYNL